MTPTLSVDITLPLEHFDLRVSFETTSQVTGIFGASGAGKTSLLEALAGLRSGVLGRVTQGAEVWLDSALGQRLAPEQRRIGYVPQDLLLFPHLNVHRNLLSGAMRGDRRGAVEETFGRVCRLLELEPLLQRGVGSLSGGERQRVALGRALCSQPQLLLMDEPLASLDLPLRRRVLPFLRRVRQELDVPIVLISHDPFEVQALCDDLLVLDKGRLLARGAPSQVLTDPAVFPLAEEQGYENVLPCTLESSGEGVTTVLLGEQQRLITRRGEGAPGSSALVAIPAREVLIATEEPRGLSARNVLAAELTAVRAAGAVRLITARLGNEGPELAVEVTEEARSQLCLEPGLQVFLIIKSTGCRLFSEGDS